MAVEHYGIIIKEKLGSVDYNPACFDFSETEAREKKLWRSEKPMPTSETMETENAKIVTEQASTQYQRDRQAEYPSLLELTVALYDTDDKSAVEAKRAAVKLKYPKPA